MDIGTEMQYSYKNSAQLLAAVSAVAAVGVDQPPVQFPCINPRCTLSVNSPTAASVQGTLYVSPTGTGAWVQVGTFNASANGASVIPDSGSPSNCTGNFWKFNVTGRSGDTSATVDFFLEG